MTVSIDDLPPTAAAASLRLRDAVLHVLGDDLVAMWLHGGTTFADRPLRPGDLDIAGVLRQVAPDERRPSRWRTDPGSTPSRIFSAQELIAREVGVDFDALYLVADEIGSGRLPRRAFRQSHRESGWPVYRAHWLAGQYVPLHGREPSELVVAPTAAELRRALDRELEHLERHVVEGDAGDPYEATYGILNGCRILRTLATGNPVISKRSAGDWGLEHLPARWHESIRAAQRSYDAVATADDIDLLAASMPAFVDEVRRQLPPPASRMGRRPRWS
jgi:hypothetical protein